MGTFSRTPIGGWPDRGALSGAIIACAAAFVLVAAPRANAQTSTVGVRLGPGNDCVEIGDLAVSATDETSASATGVVGGGGRDSIRSTGTLSVTGSVASAESTLAAEATGILADSDGGKRKRWRSRKQTVDCEAQRAGKRHRHGKHAAEATTITNDGTIVVDAGVTGGDSAAPLEVAASAAGVVGSASGDRIENRPGGRIEARSTVTAATLELASEPAAAPAAEAASVERPRSRGPRPRTHKRHGRDDKHGDRGPDPEPESEELGGPSTVTAAAVGVAGGGGDDTLTNDGEILASASTSLTANDVSASFVTLPETATWNSTASAGATAVGIDGTDGDDTIASTDSIAAEAAAAMSAGSVTLTGAGFATLSTSSSAAADATAIAGGDGDDRIDAAGTLSATSTASAEALGVGITVAGITTVSDTSLDSGTSATARATGVAAGAGSDRVENTGTATILADADTLSTQANLSAVGIGRAEAASTATAVATGVDAGKGDDEVTNAGTLTTTAEAFGDGREVAITAVGFALSEAPTFDGGTKAHATAEGVAGGTGDDLLTNDGTLTTSADAETRVGTLTATLSMVATPKVSRLTANAISDLASDAEATAVGMSGGAGDDTVRNGTDAVIDVDADAQVAATEINLGLEGNTIPFLGLLRGIINGTGAARSTTAASGIDGGDGDDRIFNEGTVDANADADLPQLGVSLRVTNGPSVDLDSILYSDAAAIRAGAGDDLVHSSGALIATADTSAFSLGVGATTSGLFSGVSSALELESLAVGIDGGAGDDELYSASSISASAFSNGTAINGVLNLGEPATPPPGGGGTGGTPPAGDTKPAAPGPTFGIVRAVSGVATDARAIGIDADGPLVETVTELGIDPELPVIPSAGINRRIVERPATGDDTIVNDGTIDLEAQARSITLAAAAGLSYGIALAQTTTTAGAEATAILAGGGDDEIANHGVITNLARANADSVNFALSLPERFRSATVALNGGTDTTARSVGIDADGSAAERVDERFLGSDLDNSTTPTDSVALSLLQSTTTSSGDDVVINDATIDSFARAVTLSADAAVGSRGVSIARSDSSAAASSAAIDGGGGDDELRNSGELLTHAVANTDAAAAAAVLDVGKAAAWSGGSVSAARAVGIAGDGGDESTLMQLDLIGSTERAEIDYHSETTRDSGDDFIENDGRIEADAVAVNVEVDVGAVLTQGFAVAIADSSSSAETVAIDAGGGDDKVVNRGEILSDAFANADSVAATFSAAGGAVAVNALVDGGTRTTATSYGIDTDSHAESADDLEASSELSLVPLHVASDIARDTTRTGNDGDDRVHNEGTIDTTARAAAVSLAGGVLTMRGAAGAISSASSVAETAAIRTGGGDDRVTNEARVTATAFGNADTVNVTMDSGGVALTADALLRGGTQARAVATGIETDGGAHETESHTRLAHDDLSVLIEQSTADRAAAGDDYLHNEGEVVATANTLVPSIGVSITGGGVGAVLQAASSESIATALGTGGGDDVIVNESARLEATARANADVVNVSVAGTGLALAADGIFNGGATSTAVARGIDADGRDSSVETSLTISRGSMCGDGELCPRVEPTSDGTEITHRSVREYARGDDVVVNSGEIDATTLVVSPSIGVSVATTLGGAIVVSRATAEAESTGIEVGAGADKVVNSGQLDVAARANGDAISVAVAVAGGAAAGNAVWDGGLSAAARATGIAAGGLASEVTTLKLSTSTGDEWVAREHTVEEDAGRDVVVNKGQIDSTAFALAPAVSVAVAPAGVSVALSTATGDASALGIETGAGEDKIHNEGDVTATATTWASAINVSVAPAGLALSGDAVWDGGTTATSSAAAIDAGKDGDDIYNDGILTSSALSLAPSLSVPVAVYGVAGAITTATSQADAFGIAAGEGDDTVVNVDAIDAGATANADSFGVSVNVFGVGVTGNAAWDGGVNATANAAAIDTGDGKDYVFNDAAITAEGDALTINGQVPFTVGGVAAALSTATARSGVAGIHTGGANDKIDNRGDVTASSDATAFAVTGSIGVFGLALSLDAIWDGGTTAEASAAGIDAGAGDDRIGNDSKVDVHSLSRATSSGGTVSAIGVATAITTASSTARADGIAAGDGDDKIGNSGEVIAGAEARATNFAIDIAGGGAAAALDATWNGGTQADADAVGLGGGAGEDEIANVDRIQADATADTDSTSIAGTVGVFGAATSASTAQSRSTAIDGGTERDRIDNDGELVVTSTADAGGISFSVTGAGAAFADTFMDNATRAEAWAGGIRGGDEDDKITLYDDSDIDVTATARNKATNVTISLVGYGQADSTALAAANAVGVEGGVGADRLRLGGIVDVTADASSLARAVTVPVLGVGFADVANGTEATAVGAAGAGGEDRIVSEAAIDAAATATTVGRTIAVQAGVATFGDARTSALATAVGIDGAGEDDAIVNAESLAATSTATVTGRSFGLSLLGGYTANHADATADSFATGIAGGDGDDEIVNLAVADPALETDGVAASSTATATAIGTTINVFGVGNGSTGAHATATATGIAGGEGKNRVDNFGTVESAASATATEADTAWTLGGVARANGLATATTNAYGLAGEAGRDRLYNRGSVAVGATSILNTSGSSTAFLGGVPSGGATLTSALLAVGIDGRDGADEVFNLGSLGVTSSSTLTAGASSWTLAGASSLATPDGGLVLDSDVLGLSGGAGEDWLGNKGAISLTASGSGAITSSSWTFAGAASDNGTLTSSIRAMAIHGGGDDDWIGNWGTVDVTAANALTATGGARALFGNANGGADLGVSTTATGLAGGSGDDYIGNASDVTIDATASLTTTSLFSTFAGGAAATPTIGATASAAGITADDGADVVENAGAVDVEALASLTATGGTATRFGDANVDSTTTAAASATGVATGDGDDRFVNHGLVSATATALPTETANAAAGGLFVDGISRGSSTTTLTSAGASLGLGADKAVNRGTVEAASGATIGVTAASTGTSAIGLSLNAESEAAAAASSATAVGIDGGDGRNVIANMSAVTVTLDPSATATAEADGAGLGEGDGVATATASANAVDAAGIRTGEQADDIDNRGVITVSALPSLTADSVSDADGLDFFTAPRSTANASSLANDTHAAGIDADGGDNRIVNDGTIDVTAAPTASALQATAHYSARNDGSGNPITLAVDSFATSGAEANGTRAAGIVAGDGRNVVRNRGTIDVLAQPTALATALAAGTGWDGDAEALATALANDAQAVGIVLGNGGNLVINDGAIIVRAEATASAEVEAVGGLAEFSDAITITVTERIPVRFGLLRLIVGYVVRTVTQTIESAIVDAGEEVEEAEASAGVAAIGIMTGDGNDKIVNNGLIDTSTRTTMTTIETGTGLDVSDTVTGLGDGIRAGGGDDLVVLNDGSVILGNVRLEGGDDTLELHGTALTAGGTFGGDGTDSIELHGTGEYLGALLEFERAIKRANGTFTVGALPGVTDLAVTRGTLRIAGDHALPANGTFGTVLYADGAHGRLEATGAIGLDGGLEVVKAPGKYGPGMQFEIVEAESVTGAFAAVTLPDSSPRLIFELLQTPTSVEVLTTRSSFTKFLKPKHALGTKLAAFGDDLATTATGHVAQVVDALQDATAPAAVNDALTHLSPAAYNTMTLGTLTSVRRGLDAVRDRAAMLRDFGGDRASSASRDGPIAFLEQTRGAVSSWGAAFGRSGGAGAANGYGAFDYDSRGVAAGWDVAVGRRSALGASFSATDTSIELFDAAGDVDGYLASIYGATSFGKNLYAAGAVAFGTSETVGVRSFGLDLAANRGRAEYDAEHRSAFFELGRVLDAGGWQAEAYGGLHFVALHEHGFAEEGLGDFALLVDGRNVESLTAELGWRVGRELELRRGTLTPRFAAAYLRELDAEVHSVSRLAGVPEPILEIPGRETSAAGARLGVGLDYTGGAERTWSVRWDAEQRGDFEDSGLLLQFHTSFR